MKVSILIPTFNRLDYLQQSLTSALSQTYEDIEVLISDDGSTDGTLQYVKEIEASDSRVRLLPSNPQPGLFTNVNHLISHTTGDAFCILGDDDRLLSQFVKRLVEPLTNSPTVVAAFCDHWIINATGQRLQAETHTNSTIYGRTELAEGEQEDALLLAMRGSICMGFSLYRSSIFRSERFDVGCGGAADFDYAIRASQLGKLYFVKEKLGEYRAHLQTATVTRPDFMLDGIVAVFKKHAFGEPRYEKLRRKHLAERLRAQALYYSTVDRGKHWRAVTEYLKLRANPFDVRLAASISLSFLPLPMARHFKRKLTAFKLSPLRNLSR